MFNFDTRLTNNALIAISVRDPNSTCMSSTNATVKDVSLTKLFEVDGGYAAMSFSSVDELNSYIAAVEYTDSLSILSIITARSVVNKVKANVSDATFALIDTTSLTAAETAVQNAMVTYSITATEGGTITFENADVDQTVSYYVGDTLNLTAVTENGYTFTGWQLNGEIVSTSVNYTAVFTKDYNLLAVFTPDYSNNYTFIYSNE